MKAILKILIIMLLFSFGEKIYSQATSTQGTDFWLSFGRNRDISYTVVNLQVRIVTGDAATVTFTYTESGTTNTVNIAAGSVYTHAFLSSERSRVYSFYTGTTSKSLHIESDVPVSVYTLNQKEYTADATNILPINGLGNDYYHISYKSNDYTYNDGYTLVATENNTEIYEDGILKETLQKGQVYSAYFGATDVTGKHITSNHPVAYFVTNGGVWLPTSLRNGADCLYQQLVPVNKWGNNFLVPVTHRGIERVRIVASQDGTVISQSGGTITTDDGGYSTPSLNLNRGQFVELETNLNTCGCYISSNKPVGVCTYLVGEYYSPPVSKGDPSIGWVPPVEQSINGALIAPFIPTGGASQLDEHFALIVTPTATKNQTTMAIGTNPPTGLSGGQWCDNTASNFSFYSIPLNNNTSDAYYFANPYGLTVMGYGIGNTESYYYLAGAASRDLDAAFYANNVHYQDLDGNLLCDTVVNFRASLQYAMNTVPGYLKWYVDGVEQTAARDILEWSCTLPVGVHNVYIKVLDMDNDTITLSATFGVDAAYRNIVNATICSDGEYHDDNFDIVPTAEGFISDSLIYTTTLGCDSIFVLNLTVNPAYNDTIYFEGCPGDCYTENGFNICANGEITIMQTKSYQTASGCDSLVTLHFVAHREYDDTIKAAICLGDEYNHYGFDTIPTQAGTLIYTHHDTTIYGCDSLTTLNLLVRPAYHDTIKAEICLGGNYTDENFNETPSTAGITYYTRSYTTTLGCDSMKILQLTTHPVYDTTIYAEICLGQDYRDDDDNFYKNPTTSGIITDSVILDAIGGCDSIIRLHLTVNIVYFDTIIDTICLGDTYTEYNFNEKPEHAGNFQFVNTETTASGCDSITTLLLTVNRSYHDTIRTTICMNAYYDDYGFYIVPVQRGVFTYVHDLTTSKNCDSITTLLLTVNPNYDEYIHVEIYEDEFYEVGNYKYNTPGLHIASLQTAENCDSIINLYLDVIYYPSAITAFSPLNKDGINDYFMAGFKVQIFNRYGAIIYETKTEEEQASGWDGRNARGQNVEPGLYFYILYNSSGKPRIKSSVEVLKR
ncbi:MAG: gliding motility-associated C-terminal domain-containing protein [Prevotellaceae bacterium]|jgi:hypothetical protein|nr:gliding motility-associated C-terminal domain-containing protein [Prevotellaceae bacterium]